MRICCGGATSFHQGASVYLEPQRELQGYWDSDPEPLALTIVANAKKGSAPHLEFIEAVLRPVENATEVARAAEPQPVSKAKSKSRR